jgi:hypothetical protein
MVSFSRYLTVCITYQPPLVYTLKSSLNQCFVTNSKEPHNPNLDSEPQEEKRWSSPTHSFVAGHHDIVSPVTFIRFKIWLSFCSWIGYFRASQVPRPNVIQVANDSSLWRQPFLVSWPHFDVRSAHYHIGRNGSYIYSKMKRFCRELNVLVHNWVNVLLWRHSQNEYLTRPAENLWRFV